jgi:DNA-directed RNA polymerase specialized sigma24 family protein
VPAPRSTGNRLCPALGWAVCRGNFGWARGRATIRATAVSFARRMDDTFDLIQALREEWDAVGGSAPYRAALSRWQSAEPALARFDSPADIVAWCRTHPAPADANPPVGALLRVAADAMAARTLLQVLLPGLTVRIGRAAVKEARCRRAKGPLEEITQEVVSAAWEQIALLAGSSPGWPACAVIEGAWRRVRYQREKGRACQRRLWPLEAAGGGDGSDQKRTPAEELTLCLVDAVRGGRLRPGQAGVVYTTRVLGLSPRELVGRCGPDERAVRARRARAERALTA